MATLKPIDNALSTLTRWAPNPALSHVIQWSLDARRAIILGKRAKGGALFGTDGPDTTSQPEIDMAKEELTQKRENIIEPTYGLTHSFKTPGNEKFEDYIAIVDIDAKGPNNGYSYITLPFIPREVNYNADSTFASIKPIARNNAKYHYTGSEDKIEFEIDWHSFNSNRYDVITKCRAIEALSKGDAYNNPPHRVMLQWGSSNVLFKDHVFVVLSAGYRLTQFNKAQVNQSNGQIESTHLLPIQAYQRVCLGRITSTNLSMREIEYVATLNNY